MEQAKPDSWKNQPMPEQHSVLDFTEEFSSEQFEKISLGHMPKDMDDKWFIYLGGNILNFHRSWTGHCIYRVEFSHGQGKYVAHRATVNRHPEQYKLNDDKYDSELLHFLISNLLLEKNEPFPLPPNISTDSMKGAFQHNVSGTGYPEVSPPRRHWWQFWK